MYLVYILQSDNLSYIGMTNDFSKRWKQHNQLLSGGAKYTSQKKNWTPLCIIDGFTTKSEAMQCEWRLKRKRGYDKRIYNLKDILINETQWTRNSPLISSQNICIYVVDKYKDIFTNISIPIKELYWY